MKLAAAFLILTALSGSLWALPTMIRLGYANCVSCHVTPQGGGLLNSYGRGIDQAQSYQGGDYKPSDSAFARLVTLGGRMRQDVRWTGAEAASSPNGVQWDTLMRNRLVYRNATELGRGFRATVALTVETRAAQRPIRAYDPALAPGRVQLSTALVQFRPKQGFEVAAGRDLLPTAFFVSDLGALVRTRNRGGNYDTPTQVKAFFWGQRYQVTPFAFAPGGNEPAGQGESGGGTLAEYDLFGAQKTVVGVTALRGSASDGGRRLLGGYVRLGFGRWGFLAEHDVTDRTVKASAIGFRQHTSYAVGFLAMREWLVASVSGEQLAVARPYREDLRAVKVQLSARISPKFTLSADFRMQRNVVTGTWSPSAAVQIAMKPVF